MYDTYELYIVAIFIGKKPMTSDNLKSGIFVHNIFRQPTTEYLGMIYFPDLYLISKSQTCGDKE